jgi:hypothetical protein
MLLRLVACARGTFLQQALGVRVVARPPIDDDATDAKGEVIN